MSSGTILATLVTALVGGLGVALYLVARAAWRWDELDAVGRSRIAKQVVFTGLMFSLVVGFPALLAAAAIDHLASPVVTGGVIAVALAVWLDRSTRSIDTIIRLGRQIRDPKRAPRALEQLLEIASSASPDDAMGASVIISAATALSNGGYDREALPLFESVKVDKLSDHERELQALGIIDALLVLGETERARALFAHLPLMEEGGFHWYAQQSLEARLLLADGKATEALALVREPVEDRDVERGRQAVRAHCYAALGKLDRCYEALGWLHEQFGDEGLRRVMQTDGPASPHARAWLDRGTGPYRG